MYNPSIAFFISFVIALHFSGCSTPEPRPVNRKLVQDLAEPLGVKIDRIATRYDIKLRTAHRLIEQESTRDPNAISPTGAIGYAQVLRSTAKTECGVKELYLLAHPEINLNCGFLYLSKLQKRYGEYWGLVAYNAGPGIMLNPKGYKNGPKKYADALKYASAILREPRAKS